MELIKYLGIALLLAGCNMGGGLTGSGTPSDEHRGEADAVNPARNVTVICQNDNTGVTVNITNNCNKDNKTADPTVVNAPAPVIVRP